MIIGSAPLYSVQSYLNSYISVNCSHFIYQHWCWLLRYSCVLLLRYLHSYCVTKSSRGTSSGRSSMFTSPSCLVWQASWSSLRWWLSWPCCWSMILMAGGVEWWYIYLGSGTTRFNSESQFQSSSGLLHQHWHIHNITKPTHWPCLDMFLWSMETEGSWVRVVQI